MWGLLTRIVGERGVGCMPPGQLAKHVDHPQLYCSISRILSDCCLWIPSPLYSCLLLLVQAFPVKTASAPSTLQSLHDTLLTDARVFSILQCRLPRVLYSFQELSSLCSSFPSSCLQASHCHWEVKASLV